MPSKVKSGESQRLFKSHPEKIPENQRIIQEFRKEHASDLSALIRLPFDQKKERELFEPWANRVITTLKLYESKEWVLHIQEFGRKWLTFLEQQSNQSSRILYKNLLRESYKKVEDFADRVDRKYSGRKTGAKDEPPVDLHELESWIDEYQLYHTEYLRDSEDKQIWQFIQSDSLWKNRLASSSVHSNLKEGMENSPEIARNMQENIQQERQTAEEINEFAENTSAIAMQQLAAMQATIHQLDEQRSTRIVTDQTIKIGSTQVCKVCAEFWDFYQKIPLGKTPLPDLYFGGSQTEQKIHLLIDSIQQVYLDRIYPVNYPAPVISWRFQEHPTKLIFVADTHGSFLDTQKIIHHFLNERNKAKEQNINIRIIFIGDFIDRNALDIHNLLYILAFNLQFPENVLLLRGNHEEITINSNYGFGRNLTEHHFSSTLFAAFNNFFKDLPLMAYLRCPQGNICLLHGGIPLLPGETPAEFEVPDIFQYQYTNRRIVIDEFDPVTTQILWNDPMEDFEQNDSPYYPNHRGIGYIFGKEVFDEFCAKNNLVMVFRGHQVFQDGFRSFFKGGFNSFFSATEYGRVKIKASCIEMESTDIFNYKVREIRKDL
jgi:hypothetical protein